MKKVAIIGHFGGMKTFLDGQTVKTKILYEELEKKGSFQLYKVDTYYKNHNPIRLIWQTFYSLFMCSDVFVLLSERGMGIYFPLLYLMTKIKRIRVYHNVIGGDLDVHVKRHPNYLKYLNSFYVNWVEIDSLKQKLDALGVTNAEILPNFKNLQKTPAVDYQDRLFRFCTFSRVMKEKGIEDAVAAIKKVNEINGKIVCTLDIYGAVDEQYKDSFEELEERFGDDISYKGLVSFGESVSVLKSYYALLFPTFWYGEGFPGTVLDAYASAIPVIASDWNYNRELISHMRTGLIYPNESMTNLDSCIQWAIENVDIMNTMRKNCADEYLKYSPEDIMKKIMDRLD